MKGNAMKKIGCIGQLRNNWRQRMVYVYPLADPTKVETEGFPLNGLGDPIICSEAKSDWERVIGLYPKVAVYD
jgi:hypothetical protein